MEVPISNAIKELEKRVLPHSDRRISLDEVYNHPKESKQELFEPIFPIQNLPNIFLDRFYHLLPSLAARRLSYTSKRIYYQMARSIGIPAIVKEKISEEGGDYLTEDGDLILDYHHHSFVRPFKYLKIKSLIVQSWLHSIRPRKVPKIYPNLMVTIDNDFPEEWKEFFHSKIFKAYITIYGDLEIVNYVLKLLPNVEYLWLNALGIAIDDVQKIKDLIKNWIKEKNFPVKIIKIEIQKCSLFIFDDNLYQKNHYDDNFFVESL